MAAAQGGGGAEGTPVFFNLLLSLPISALPLLLLLPLLLHPLLLKSESLIQGLLPLLLLPQLFFLLQSPPCQGSAGPELVAYSTLPHPTPIPDPGFCEFRGFQCGEHVGWALLLKRAGEERSRSSPVGSRQGGATQTAGQGRGLHLGLLPELLAVNPLHLHSRISLLIGGTLQSQGAWCEGSPQAKCSGAPLCPPTKQGGPRGDWPAER